MNTHDTQWITPPVPKPQGKCQQWEIPTWLMVAFVFGSYYLLMTNAADMAWWLLAPMAGLLLCLHGSLQHEILHGHPTRIGWLNDLIGWAPLSLWLPYSRYRDSHRLHHEVEALAEPGLDPESYYHMPKDWDSKSGLEKRLWELNFTFLGRMIIGPCMALWGFFKYEGSLLLKGDAYTWKAWIPHFILTPMLVMWLQEQGIELWYYILVCVWPGISLSLMRSYTEHRPESDNHRRTALVEGNWFTNTLYMGVNIHQVHHEHAGMPWFMVKPYYLANKKYVLARNGGFYYKGYLDIIKRFLLKQKDSPIYPR